MKNKKKGKLNTKPKSSPIQDEEELNVHEQKAIEAQVAADEEESKKVSFKKMEKAVALLEETFNLKDQLFNVTAFTDKGNTVKVSMSNGAFDVAITINDAEAFGLMSE